MWIRDRPGTALDVTIQDQILRLIKKLVEEGKLSVIMVTHSLGAVSYTHLRVRKYAREQPIAEAVERAITECIQEGILKEFLEKNRRERCV